LGSFLREAVSFFGAFLGRDSIGFWGVLGGGPYRWEGSFWGEARARVGGWETVSLGGDGVFGERRDRFLGSFGRGARARVGEFWEGAVSLVGDGEARSLVGLGMFL